MRREGRPVFLNLLKIRLPVPGVASIAHRISGVLLFLAIPLFLFIFQRSLQGEAGYAEALALLRHPLVMLISLVLLWSLLHHWLAGIRYLLIDVDVGVERTAARKSAWTVLILAPVLTVIILGVLWL
ncbi:succinate dehydrogenase, cytochrome b556 subunit [Thioalkalivibrio sulfidiphilus]|uniref:Succinate dehydrogenase cytochrome b556 subunit n=1 Tax=Thioalkalivibrio sulfidiphilus (strain HL-EbGR7) TaxID=396588 RepID=B8GRJ5_THISH|nr:succinate dehydrogenase, cytochrome b556 subunit [Thioalkalivibrio sulfidiphilus]ACL72549.1 succinate dehydrogenase, cytochrome b556 subunit [Thioalkalivibrio sulfidiphilus HL-EbGr7]